MCLGSRVEGLGSRVQGLGLGYRLKDTIETALIQVDKMIVVISYTSNDDAQGFHGLQQLGVQCSGFRRRREDRIFKAL